MINGLTDVEKDKRISLRQAVFFIVSLPVAAAFALVGLAWGLHYAPTTVQGYTIIPDVVCPGQETELRTAFDVVRPVMGSVDTFSVDSTWTAEGRPDRVGIPEASFSFHEAPFNGRYGHHVNVSPVKRFAPNDPGKWRLETTLTTYGVQVFHRVENTVTGIVSNTVTVLPFGDESCRGAGGA